VRVAAGLVHSTRRASCKAARAIHADCNAVIIERQHSILCLRCVGGRDLRLGSLPSIVSHNTTRLGSVTMVNPSGRMWLTLIRCMQEAESGEGMGENVPVWPPRMDRICCLFWVCASRDTRPE
jgi:hypothetical protein